MTGPARPAWTTAPGAEGPVDGVQFLLGPATKPGGLSGKQVRVDLRFMLSHGDAWVVCAVWYKHGVRTFWEIVETWDAVRVSGE